MGPKPGIVPGIIFLLALSSHLLPIAETANIVFFLGISSYSHRSSTWPLAEALAEKGHNVTFISPEGTKTPNPKIFDYVPPTLAGFIHAWLSTANFYQSRKDGDSANAWGMEQAAIVMCEILYSDEDYLNWVKRTKVDLVIIDGLFNECAYGMAHFWGAKAILFHTGAPMGNYIEPYGFPDESSWIPSIEFPCPVEMSFFDRMSNAIRPILWEYNLRSNYFPRLGEITRERLGMAEPVPFEEVVTNTSMVFLSIHYAEEFSRALPPNIITVGGIGDLSGSAEKRKPLPKDIGTFLQKGNGFIYLSFGSHVDFFTMDKEIQQAFIGAMKSLPDIQFIWKIGNDSFAKEFPQGNVFMAKWMPQKELLAHPKIKGFITHSGLNSIHEAIYDSVPLICFPFFAEQDYNAERIHWKETGIRLEITSVTQVELVDALKKLISDPKYRNNMKKVSSLFRERPQKPLDTALWWTEFVLRHSQEEISALKPLSVGQPWWKKRQLDVWATIAAIVTTLLLSIIFVSYKILSCVFGSSSSRVTPSHQRKKIQ